jgi:hypothetical protein
MMDIDTGRTVKDKRCKIIAVHVEHHWYDAPNDQWSRCDGRIYPNPDHVFGQPPAPIVPPGSEVC